MKATAKKLIVENLDNIKECPFICPDKNFWDSEKNKVAGRSYDRIGSEYCTRWKEKLSRVKGGLSKSYKHKKCKLGCKLFAVTQDIKTGDEIIDIDTNRKYRAEAIGKNSIVTDADGYDIPKEYCYKVLGEISSEAIWVKDGDEIEAEPLKVPCGKQKAGTMFVKNSQCNTYH